MAYTFRTRFKKEIVAEFLPPARPTKKTRVIIIAPGMPGLPSRGAFLEFLSKKGFWAFAFRYRGSWESEGSFLKVSPHKDVLDIIDALPKGFAEAWGGKRFRLHPEEIFIFAGSFGGPAGILALNDPRISKVVAFSPVIDWRAPSKKEPLDFMARFIQEGFGAAYRGVSTNWKKLKTGTFYNPMAHAKEIDGSKLFILHAKDDGVVRWNEVAKFARQTGSKLKLFKKGGHFSMGRVAVKHWGQISAFLKK